eukprot:scaffold76689_cov31-Tisochrysis_lutea.AAC.1
MVCIFRSMRVSSTPTHTSGRRFAPFLVFEAGFRGFARCWPSCASERTSFLAASSATRSSVAIVESIEDEVDLDSSSRGNSPVSEPCSDLPSLWYTPRGGAVTGTSTWKCV